MATFSLSPRQTRASRFIESAFWIVSGAVISLWSFLVGADLVPHFIQTSDVSLVLSRHAGASALFAALVLMALTSFIAGILALRSKTLAQPSASVLLITACALRAVQILSESSVTVADANILGGLFLAAAIVYGGPIRLWWTLLMPLASLAAFVPLVWLEYLKGAHTNILIDAVIAPGSAFVMGSIVIVIRDLRARAKANVTELRQLRLRGESSMRLLRSMEVDMKALTVELSQTSKISAPAAVISNVSAFEELPLTPETTEFVAPGRDASETCSFDEIDTMSRQVLEDARASAQGGQVRILLTAPTAASVPMAVRGSLSQVYVWMKSSVFMSLEALGGFPGGVVRVNLRAGLSAVSLSIEDNGRGIGEKPAKNREDGLLSYTEIRSAVEALGGRFDLQARLGVGARITIELPRVDAFATLPRATTRISSKAGFDQSLSN